MQSLRSVLTNLFEPSSRVRSVAILVHRWVGLTIAAFLLVAGLTGSLLAFFADLDAALNPELFVVEPRPGAKLLEPLELHSRLQQRFQGKERIDGVILEIEPNRTVNYWIDERETFVDPYTAEVVGSRRFGDLSEGKKNLLTFLYRFHYSLSLGDVGTWLFGIIAILWTLDCFVGAYLTFPQAAPQKKRGAGKSWLARWLPAWLLKSSRLFSLVFTWHRASGLWVWGLLLVFAWSAVALNLGEQVYEPVMNGVFGKTEHAEPPALAEPRKSPKLGFSAALERGRQLMAEECERQRFRVLGERWLSYDPERGVYGYVVESTRDVDERLAGTEVHFDGDDGRALGFHAPTGESARGTLDAWLIALHFGAVREGGVAYRAFVAVLGVLVALLSVTGVWIWWRKRSKRALSL